MVFAAIWGLLLEVIFFWQRVRNMHEPNCWRRVAHNRQRFLNWLTQKKPVELWFSVLKDAQTYDEWEEAAFQLDVLLGNDLWQGN